MKLKVYNTIEESWRLGDLNSSSIKHFLSEDQRDKYFEHLYSGYADNKDLTMHNSDFDKNEFEFDDNVKWSYVLRKEYMTMSFFETVKIDNGTALLID
jgi:hypothetical protein